MHSSGWGAQRGVSELRRMRKAFTRKGIPVRGIPTEQGEGGFHVEWWHQQQSSLRCGILNENKMAFIQGIGQVQGVGAQKG